MTSTMDAIKKKMQSMKQEKEVAMDRADQMEQKTKELEEKNKLVIQLSCLKKFAFFTKIIKNFAHQQNE